MSARKILLIAAPVVVAGAIVAAISFYSGRAAPNTLLVSGNIEAHESVLGFQVPGRIIDLVVEEGTWVEKDAIIARLDDRDYRQQVANDAAALKVAEAELTLALAGSRRQEVEAARQAVIDTQAEMEQRRIDYDRATRLFRDHVISKEARDLAETGLKRATANHAQAVQNYDKAVEGTRKENIEIARAHVEYAREALKMAQINLDHTMLRAPHDGVVVVRQSELGEYVAPGAPVMTVADLDDLWLRAYIDETDLGRIRWGQAAAVSTDTWPGKTYAGRISFISEKAEFTPKSVETHKERVTLVYRIKIDLKNPNYELKPGMPADATIALTPPASNGAHE
jgi:HlyD family secretion protein